MPDLVRDGHGSFCLVHPLRDKDLSGLVIVVAVEGSQGLAKVNDQRLLLHAAALASLHSKSTAPVPELECGVEALQLRVRGIVIRQDPHAARVVGDVHEPIGVRGAASFCEQQQHDGSPRATATTQGPPR
jgi:hypothetical protein